MFQSKNGPSEAASRRLPALEARLGRPPFQVSPGGPSLRRSVPGVVDEEGHAVLAAPVGDDADVVEVAADVMVVEGWE